MTIYIFEKIDTFQLSVQCFNILILNRFMTQLKKLIFLNRTFSLKETEKSMLKYFILFNLRFLLSSNN